ncbi:MAG: aldo/keto reductase [Candidatus Omnitrophica bacterium]|nr:aldo/keto reductase [Candidatus Omnitrophota bacterium]
MEYKKLGNTDIEVSRIGFGCWAIGGHGYGKVDDEESVRAIRKALDLGINFFDTADIYGLGHSEKILSRGLGKSRGEVVIATKVGVKWDNNTKTSSCDLSPEYIVKALESSLRRLKIDCIPLYQIHYPDPKTPVCETMEILGRLQKEGKIRHIGVSNFSASLVDEIKDYGQIESLQVYYNLLNWSIGNDIRSLCEKLKISVFAYGSLAQGLLSGKYDERTGFGEDDHRNKSENFGKEKLKANLVIVDKLKEVAGKYKKGCAQVALNWILGNPDITSALVGVKTSGQIEQNAGAAGWSILAEDYDLITEIATKTYLDHNLKSD